jgi:hypothetical protein
MLQIDKGVPIPPRQSPSKYPLRQMEVGDSFEVKFDPEEPYVRAKLRMGASLQRYRTLHGWKFTTRKTGPDTIRVWRSA